MPTTSDHVPGLALAVCGASVGWLIHRHLDALSPHVVAVIVGVAVGNLVQLEPLARARSVLAPGLRTAARRVLRVGIVLVGFRLSLREVAQLGPRSLVAVCIVVAVTFIGIRWLGRAFGLGRGLSLLVATGYAICGASAIAAVEPFADATEEEAAYAVALVTLCGSAAIVTLPLLGRWLGLSNVQFGSWVGASVHDVGQVVAAASGHGPQALSTAVVVKLTRVLLLAPMLTAIAIGARRRAATSTTTAASTLTVPVTRTPIMPLFVVLFLVAVTVRSSGVVPLGWFGPIQQIETLLVGAGLVGLGSAVDIGRLRQLGGRPLLLGLVSWALIVAVSLVAVRVTG